MKSTLKIGLCGPHSSGKTTLLNALTFYFTEKDISVLPEITRVIQKQGIAINEDGGLDSQILVMATHMQNLLTRDNFIVDRCLVDGYCYTEYLYNQRKVPTWFMNYSKELVRQYLGEYDIIFYLPAEIPLVADGVRSSNASFREKVVKIFEKNIPIFEKDAYIVNVSGTVEERMILVINSIEKLLSDRQKKEEKI